MSAEPDKTRDALSEQLASFDDRLAATSDDVDLLADIQQRIGGLLASNGSNEADIRQVLQDRYESGSLRKETFELVKSMLDRYVKEDHPTSPEIWPVEIQQTRKSPSILDEFEEPKGDDAFGTTTVIPNDVHPVPTAESRVQVGSLLRDRFLLQKKVAGGSMGVVYKALDRRLAEAESEEPWVAVKVLSPQLSENVHALRALQQEATKGRCLVHPNIVRFIDLDRDDDLYFLILEWLDGRTLADILDSADAKSIDHDAAFRIVSQVGDALDYAHRCGIVHADVKPGNIMLMPDGEAKLFDFGVARVRQTQFKPDFDPAVLGALTPAYSSMQVLTGDEPVPSDDVFSLGCLLYRLVAGHRVFGPRNAAEASQEGMNPQRPQGLSDGQWRALKKALSYSRVTRFSSVQEFTEALKTSGDDTIDPEGPDDFDTEKSGGRGKWIAAIIVLFGLLGGAMYQNGVLDPWLKYVQERLDPAVPPDELSSDTMTDDLPPAEADSTAVESPVDDTFEPPAEQPAAESVQEPLVDFSTLPPADIEVPFTIGAASATNFRVRLREDGSPVIVDFVRTGGLRIPLSLKLDEVGFSGNRSPWGSRQYALSNSGILRFSVGQDRSRIVLTMASDPLREADQLSTLRLREADSAESELAVIYVTLEDDDQRAFEGKLPVNTIAFAASHVSVREADPAVQIDVVRLNPDNSPVVIGYSFIDLTATEGDDYFAPGSFSIAFGPGQRSARLLVPLVQDSDVEGDETFVVQLAVPGDLVADDVFQRIVVTIRDDEPQSP